MAIVFACEKFHQFIYGKHVEVETDHKPLVSIFKKTLNDSELQRMLLRLQQYDLEVSYQKGTELYVADTLSRAYQEIGPNDTLEEELEIHIVLPISTPKLNELREETLKDPVLQRLTKVILNSWPQRKSHLSPSIQNYWDYKEELTVFDDLIFKRNKVVIPTVLRHEMLKVIHQPHLGEEASKRRAREVLFWPEMDKDIEKLVKSCSICNQNKPRQPSEPLKPYPAPSRPWQRIGVDIFTFHGKNYLITVDFYSVWFEIDLLSDMLSPTVISKLKMQMARYGIPDVVISDNGPQFDSKQFKTFQQKWQFEHVTSSPGYPQSNGGTERAVQIAKSLMKKAVEDGADPYLSLLHHRNTPRDSILGSPAQRLMSRQTKTLLPTAEGILKPQVKDPDVVKDRLQHYKNLQKKSFDQRAQKLPILKPGDVVRLQGEKGFPHKGVVVEKLRQPRSYLVKASSRTYRRNRKHLLKVEEPIQRSEIEEDNDENLADEQRSSPASSPPRLEEQTTRLEEERIVNEPLRSELQVATGPNKYTRSGRWIKRPVRLDL